MRTPPEQGLSRLPAPARLLAGRAVAAGVRLARAGCSGEHVAARAAHLLRRPTSRCTCWARPTTARGGSAAADGFEVFSSLVGRMSLFGRRGDGRLVVRDPLSGVAGDADGAGAVRRGGRAARLDGVRLVLQLAVVGRAGAGELGVPAAARDSGAGRGGGAGDGGVRRGGGAQRAGAPGCRPAARSASSPTRSCRSSSGTSSRTTGRCWS